MRLLYFQIIVLFLVSITQGLAQNHLWSFNIGGGFDDIGRMTFNDNKGFVYAVGHFKGVNIDFNSSPTATTYLSSNGDMDAYVVKYTDAGVLVWAFNVGGSGLDEASAISVDNLGNVYVTGFFRGSNVDFDPSSAGTALLTSNGDSGGDPGYGGDVFVAKYSNAGQYLWAFNVGSPSIGDDGTALVTDALGNVYVGGYFSGNADFDPSGSVANLSVGNGLVFLAKYNTNGQYQWAFNFGSPGGNAHPFGLKIDGAANIYVTGYFIGGGADFDPSPISAKILSSNGQHDIYLAKYNSSGQYQWAFNIGSGGIDVARELDVDNAGNIYVGGDFQSTVDFDPSASVANLTSVGSSDIFIAKYDNNGNYKWAKRFGSINFDIAWGVTYTKGNVYLSGSFQGTVNFNPGTVPDNLVSNGSSDIYVTKFDLNGNYVCAFKVGGSNVDESYRMSSDTLGNFYITGYFNSYNTDFNPGAAINNLSTNGAQDVFIAKYIWPDNPRPGGILTGSTICPGQQATLTFTATAGPGPFTIEYSNGTTNYTQINVQSGVPFSLLPNPTVNTTYTLISVRDATVCPSTNNVAGITAVVTVSGGGSTDFTYKQSPCSPKTIQFFATSTGATYSWDFGNGTTSAGNANSTVTYANYGNYIVKLVVGNGGGCADSAIKTIPVFVTQSNIIFNKDTAVCPGTTLQLASDSGVAFCWKPEATINNTTIANTTVTSAVPTTYFLTSQIPGNNLLVNGDFAAGNTGFTSDYTAANPNTTESQYWIGNNPATWNSSMSNCTDHTSGSGNMLLVNGSPTAAAKVWSQTVNTTSNTNYAFSVWLQNVYAVNPANLRFSINGRVVGDNILAGTATCQWKQFYVTWNSGNVTAANLSIVNNNTIVQGNDFAIDDISFATVTMRYDSLKVSIAPNPTIQGFGDTSVCSGTTVQLGATGGNVYSWTPAGSLSNSNIHNPISTTDTSVNYVVTGYLQPGCVGRDTVKINILPKPVITLTTNNTACAGDSFQLAATGGGTYSWSPSTGLSDINIGNPVSTASSGIKYYVTVTSAQGCKNIDSVTVSRVAKPTVSTRPDTSFCKGGGTVLNTLVSNYTGISWFPGNGLSSPNAVNPLASPNDTTRYIVTATNGGCIAKDTVNIYIKPKPLVTLNNDTGFCKGFTYSLNATGGGSYQWSPATWLSGNGISNPTATPDTTTQYYVTVTGANGCATVDSVKLTVYKIPTVSTRPDTSFCKGGGTVLNTLVSNYTGISWFPGNGLSSPNAVNPLASPNDTTRYIVTATNGGCIAKDTVNIYIKPKPLVTLNNDTGFCKGFTYSLNATGGGSYQWSPATWLSGNGISNPTATPDTTTQYYVTVTGANGCATIDSVKLTVYPKPFVQTIKDTSVCLGTPRVLTTGATPGVTYLWSPGRWLSDSTVASPVANPAVYTQYVVTVNSANKCTAKDTVNLTPVALPVISKSPNDTMCKGATVNLFAGGGVSYQWLPVTGLSNPGIYNPVSSTDTSITYYVQVSGSSGCTAKDSVRVTVRPPLRPATVNPPLTSICGTDTLLLTASGGDFYKWIAGSNIFSPDSAATYVLPAGSQVYKVKITDTVCRITTILSSTVNVNAGPVVAINKSNDIDCKYPNAQLQAGGGLIYQWVPADGLSNPNVRNPVASPVATTVYSVKVMDSSGCTTTKSIIVGVNYGNNKHTYDVPDAFTPNKDGKNDCYSLRSWGNVPKLELSIFNRWGERVFFTNNTTDCWDGTYKGVAQSTAAFVYVIKATTACGGDVFKKGTLLLIR